MQTTIFLLLVASAALTTAETSLEREINQVLRSFQSFRNDFTPGSNGRYSFVYHVGDSERAEERNEEGKVSGRYAFVVPEGDEYQFKYEADEDGYQVESDALPTAPEDTEDVKKAKEAFFEAYEKALEAAEEDDYEYSAESDESDESDESESDESDESDEDDEESSEEESSEEDDDDDDEEEEESEGQFAVPSHFGSRVVPYPYNRN